MGRYTKTFEESVTYAKDLVNKKEPLDVAVNKAAEIYNEDAERIMAKILTGRVPLPEDEYKKKARTTAKRKKTKNARKNNRTKTASITKDYSENKNTSTNAAFGEVEEIEYIYEGPADIVCFDKSIVEIIIIEKVMATSKHEAKDKICEKIIQQFLPIRIHQDNWQHCLKKEAGVV